MALIKKVYFFIRNYADGMRINDCKIANDANSCAIIGAGLVGLEMAEGFKKRGRLREKKYKLS
jgi:NADPH-dependent 2,4-dienoyl-CoA reductase/sulfur reductase-like enzyme